MSMNQSTKSQTQFVCPSLFPLLNSLALVLVFFLFTPPRIFTRYLPPSARIELCGSSQAPLGTVCRTTDVQRTTVRIIILHRDCIYQRPTFVLLESMNFYFLQNKNKIMNICREIARQKKKDKIETN